MKRSVNDLVEAAFPDELLSIEPIDIDAAKMKKQVLMRIESEKEPSRLDLPVKSEPKRKILRIALIAAAITILSSTGVFAANELRKLSRNDIAYFEAGAAVQEEDASHDTTTPVFHEGMQIGLEHFNTEVGETASYGEVSATLDTVAMDDGFAVLFFTIDYGKPIDFEKIYPDMHPDQKGEVPEYSTLIHSFVPVFALSVNDSRMLENPGVLFPESQDAYFVDDQTIKVSLRYLLDQIYPNESTLYIQAIEMADANGEKIVSYETGTDRFRYQVQVDKAEAAQHTRMGAQTTDTLIVNGKEEILDIKRLVATPFGTQLELGLTREEKRQNASDDNTLSLLSGVRFSDLYMEDDQGNVIEVYQNPVMSIDIEDDSPVAELLHVGADTKAITFMPLYLDETSAASEHRSLPAEDIVGKKIEVSSLGGYTVKNLIVRNRTIELQLEPYGMCFHYGFGRDFGFDGVDVGKGLIRQQYNRETNIYTYAVDYYDAAEAELQAIHAVSWFYDDGLKVDREQAVTVSLENVN